MKKIFGLRKIKTAIAILLCLLVYIVLKAIEYIPNVEDGLAYTWYNPFFAGIATAYSIHVSKALSLRQAKNRCVASVIGGVVGIGVICLYELCGGVWPGALQVDLATYNYIIPYILVPIAAIIVIHIGVVLKQEQAVFVSILTLLSVTIGPNTGVPNWQWQFGINRILSTVVGVMIALGVNNFRLPRKNKNDNLLFVIGIEGILNRDDEIFKGFVNYKINSLDASGVKLSMFTTRTPTTFMNLLANVNVSDPIVCMSGAALYDPKSLKYLDTEVISKDVADRLRCDFKNMNITPFIEQIENDVLYTYIEKLDNLGEEKYFESKKNAAYSNLVNAVAPSNDVLYFLLVEPEELVDSVLDLIDEKYGEDLFVQVYDYYENNEIYTGLKYVKIYSKKILELRVLHDYCNSKGYDICGLTYSSYSNHLLINSDISVTISSASDDIKQKCSRIVKSDSYEDLFKEISRIYHTNLNKNSNSK